MSQPITELRRVNVRAIILKDGKLLAVKHKTSTGEESPYWAVPGGGLDPMESIEDGLQREILEETGVVAKPGKLLFIQQFPSKREGRDEELELFFFVDGSDAYQNIDLTKTSHGDAEIARMEFIDPTSEQILPAFLSTIDIARYITEDQPVYISSQL